MTSNEVGPKWISKDRPVWKRFSSFPHLESKFCLRTHTHRPSSMSSLDPSLEPYNNLAVYFDSSAMTVQFKLDLEWFRLYIYFSYILMVIAAVMVTIGIIITVITILQNLFCYGKVYRSESQLSQFLKVTRSVDQFSKHLKKILYIQRTKS